MQRTYFFRALVLATITSSRVLAADPWADAVVSYNPGTTASAGFDQPMTALGSPERFTGEGAFPGPVTLFNPAFGTDELVSIGEGGQLTVAFDEPVTDDPSNPYGIDFIAFGNGGFIDFDFPNGQIGDPTLLFGLDEALVEVSADGVSFLPLAARAGTSFPTQGYLDVGPFDLVPGAVLTDFRKPVNPALTLADFAGLPYAAALALYGGSGGGTPYDLADAGLSSISYVRFSLPDDGNPDTSLHAEIEALSTVPEPASLALLAVSGLFRRRVR